jgi:AcrR family transcriptional regulator
VLDMVDSPSPRRRGRPRAQAAVLTATLALIDEQGVKNVTVEAIAERAGISKVTLYRRWPSRVSILVDALLQHLAASAPLDESRTPHAGMVNHLLALTRLLRGRTGEMMHNVIGECQTDPDMRAVFRERYIGLRRQVAVRIIRQGQEDGSFITRSSAEQCHDALYGAIFYRFLFGVGPLDRKAVLGLMESVLQPAQPASA